jgi:hypothetical protein
MPVNQAAAFLPADSVDWLHPGDLVLGFRHRGETRAYPIPALAPIEVLNDTVDGEPVVVTWCPLSATGAVFSGRVRGQPLRFRFHPDLYHMNLLFEDAESQSTWSQLASRAVDGPEEGTGLVLLPAVQTTWSEWRRTHPGTTVLRPDWGTDAFSYRTSREEPPAGSRSERELVLVVLLGDESRAYPFKELSDTPGPIPDALAGTPLLVHFAAEGPTAFATDANGDPLTTVVVYWKYLEDFFPAIDVWGPGR